MEFKGTKGEWKITKYISLNVITDKFGNDLCDSSVLKKDAIHNAKLMAAAPDLLEALQNIIECWDIKITTENDIEHARKAIEKALK